MVDQGTERLGATDDFDTFYREQHARLVRALLLLTGQPAEAEDLAQEAFARVYERWDRVAGMDSSSGYLYRTALNLHRSFLRRLSVHRRATQRIERQPHEDSVDDRLAVLAAVAGLPRAQREALVLVEWLGFGTAEAADLLGIKAVSVRSRLMDARRSLRSR